MRIQQTTPILSKPGYLDKVVALYNNKQPVRYTTYTNTVTTKNYYNVIMGEGDLPLLSQVLEGDAVDFADFNTVAPIIVYPRIRGLAVSISKWTSEADPYTVFAKTGSKLMNAARQTMEADMANFVNLATTAYAAGTLPTQGNNAPQTLDGLALASAVHPLDNGTASNIITISGVANPPLSYNALVAAKIQLMNQLSQAGNLMAYDGDLILMVPPALEDLAMRLTMDVERGLPGTNNNDPNWAGRKTRVFVNSYFTSSTAWALVAAEKSYNPLTTLVRQPIELDTDSEKLRFAKILICSAYWTKYAQDWRNYMYSAGA